VALLGGAVVLAVAQPWMARELGYLGATVSPLPPLWVPLSALDLAVVAGWATCSMVAAAVRAQLRGQKFKA
jgi:hypothetical protein